MRSFVDCRRSAAPFSRLLLGTLALFLFASLTARAQTYTFAPFNVTAQDTANIGSVPLVGAPAGTVFTSYNVSFSWSAIAGDPYQDEAIWAFVNQPPPQTGTTVFYADPGSAPGALATGTSTILTWSGFLDSPYTGGNPLNFWFGQTFAGSSASWSNVSITLSTATITPPIAIPITSGSSVTGTLAAREIAFYSLNYVGGSLDINTLGSLLGPDNDTEIALFNASGALLATNDDIDFAGGNLLSRLTFAPGSLAAGTYYIAVGAFNSTFTNGFGATSTSTLSGAYRLNVNVAANAAAPEPGSLALVGGALLPGMAMVMRRRRRAN